MIIKRTDRLKGFGPACSRDRLGFTILEIMFVVAVTGLIVAAVYPLFGSMIKGWELNDRQFEVTQNGRVGMSRMVRVLKTATQFDKADPDKVAITDSDGTKWEFKYKGGKLQLKTGGKTADLAEPVDSLSFIYYDKNGSVTTDKAQVRSVDITMVVSDAEGKVSPVSFNSRVAIRKDYVSYKLSINEINYNPPVGGKEEKKQEWIELYNYGTTALDLSGWKIKDTKRTDDLELGPGEVTMIVPAGGYVVITADKTNVYSVYTVAPGAIKLQTDDNKIADGLGDGSDTITIMDSDGNDVDTVTYDDSWGGDGDGDTIERRDSETLPDDAGNWEASSDNSSYTAGAANTVAP